MFTPNTFTEHNFTTSDLGTAHSKVETLFYSLYITADTAHHNFLTLLPSLHYHCILMVKAYFIHSTTLHLIKMRVYFIYSTVRFTAFTDAHAHIMVRAYFFH